VFRNHQLQDQLAEQAATIDALPRDCELVRAPLTAREIRIISLVAQGLGNREIANMLARDSTTVEKHLTSIFRKFGVHNRAEAVAIARRNDMLPPN
jgi:DNA-binding NarL/FixJ family response regulator